MVNLSIPFVGLEGALTSLTCEYLAVIPAYGTYIIINLILAVFMYLNYIFDITTRINDMLEESDYEHIDLLDAIPFNSLVLILMIATNGVMLYYQFFL